MIHDTQGDMFEADFDVRVNTVNCKGVMGAGVALAFKDRYPAMFKEYREACKAGRVVPGEMHVWRTLTEWVVNFPTKRNWRQKSRYEDIEAGLVSLRRHLADKGQVRVALPALGCGHGGLDWARVRPMIEEALGDLDAEVFVFAPRSSREAGERVWRKQRAEFDGYLHLVGPADPRYPASLLSPEAPDLSVMGSLRTLPKCAVAVISSERPDERELEAGLACARALAGAGVALAVPFGTRLGHRLATAVAGEVDVVLWASAGVDRLTVPRAVLGLLEAGQAIVVTPHSANARWSRRGLATTEDLMLRTVAAVLLTGMHPELPRTRRRLLPAFFVWHRTMSDHEVASLTRQGISRVGRAVSTQGPSITPIIRAVEECAKHLSELTK